MGFKSVMYCFRFGVLRHVILGVFFVLNGGSGGVLILHRGRGRSSYQES